MAERGGRDQVIRQGFLDALRSEGAAVQTAQELVQDNSDAFFRRVILLLGKSGREMYFVGGVGLINIHVRSDPPGWWNIIGTVHNDFMSLSKLADGNPGVPCYYVFLVGRKDQHIADGYIATDFNTPPFIQAPRIEQKTKKYRVTERQNLNQNRILSSISRVARTLLQQGSTVQAHPNASN